MKTDPAELENQRRNLLFLLANTELRPDEGVILEALLIRTEEKIRAAKIY